MKASVLAALFLASSSALSAQSQPAVSWLEPPDALIQKAVDDGFSQKKLPKDALYHRFLNWIKPAVDSRIEVIPPLFCAMDAGQRAHDKLEAKPDLEKVKGLCLRTVEVIVVHYSQSLNANWPCVFQQGDFTLQPTVKRQDNSPSVATYYAGFIAGDQVGYRYIDIYSFGFPDSMAGSASLTYADETGQHHTMNYNFDVFAKDVTSRVASNPALLKQAVTKSEMGQGSPTPAAALADPVLGKQTLANSEAGKGSPAAAAALANVGHVYSPQELAELVERGQASKCAVVTVPPGAEVDIDGNKAVVSPAVFVLLKQGDTPRTITIKLDGYKTVEKKVIPDGKTIPIGLTLEKQ